MSTQGAPAGWLEDHFVQGTEHKDVGIVFVHGFTGSPAAMRPWANFINSHGYTVSVPRLPGHGTQWEDLNKVQWQQWPERVQQEIDRLGESCAKVFLCGLSMGGGTTLNVASKNNLAGIILVNPMIHIAGLPAQIAIKFAPLIALFRKGLASVSDDVKAPDVTEWGYDVLPTLGVVQLNSLLKATRSALGQVQAPTLLFHSVDDHVLPVSNTEIIMAEIGSAFKSRKELLNSYHVATLDNDAPEIFNESLEHIRRWS